MRIAQVFRGATERFPPKAVLKYCAFQERGTPGDRNMGQPVQPPSPKKVSLLVCELRHPNVSGGVGAKSTRRIS